MIRSLQHDDENESKRRRTQVEIDDGHKEMISPKCKEGNDQKAQRTEDDKRSRHRVLLIDSLGRPKISIDEDDYEMVKTIMSSIGVHSDGEITVRLLDDGLFVGTNPAKISYLSLSCEELVNLPEVIGDLKSLVSLELENTILPGSIGQLSNLQYLELSGTKELSSLPEEIGNLNGLKSLTLKFIGIESLPDSIGRLTSLQYLELYGLKHLTALPEELGNLRRLRTLQLKCQGLTSLPRSIGRLNNLEGLFLLHAKNLQRLPEEIVDLKHLICLGLDSSGITSLPDSIGQLESLEELDLSRTENLATLPDTIGKLARLMKLLLISSGLVSLPKSIGGLKSLTNLDLRKSEKLRSLPVEIGDLRFVKINIYGTNVELSSKGFWYKVLSRRARVIGPIDLSCMDERFPGIGSRLLPVLSIKAGSTYNDNWINHGPELECSNIDGLYHFLVHHRQLLIMARQTQRTRRVLSLYRDPGIVQVDEEDYRNYIAVRSAHGFAKKLNTSQVCMRGTDSRIVELDLSEVFSHFPVEICSLSKLTKLNLSHSTITNLPREIGRLNNLKELRLDYIDDLESLPEEIGDLCSLEKLVLTRSDINSLPRTIGRLRNLKELYLDQTFYLERLPEEVGDLCRLEKLVLAEMSITSLPRSIGRLKTLAFLDLSRFDHNLSLPDELGDLTNLKQLNLCNSCCITSLPLSIKNLQNLEELNLERLQVLEEGLEAISGMTNLSKLNLCKIDFDSISFPQLVSDRTLQRLRVLKLVKCNMKEFPEQICLLRGLHELYLGKNGFITLPRSIGLLQNLEILDLGWTKELSCLPEEIGNLCNLEELILNHSGIKSLPRSIGLLKKLWRFRLDYTENLESLPVEIGDISGVDFDMYESKALSLPKTFWHEVALRNAKTIDQKRLSSADEQVLEIVLKRLPWILRRRFLDRCFWLRRYSILEYTDEDNIYFFLSRHMDLFTKALMKRKAAA